MTEAHLTAKTGLATAIQAWELYLNDQGRSPNTIKAFLSDLGLMASFFPPDQTIGAITTADLNHFLHWLEHERGVPCSPKSLSRRITTIKSFFRWLQRGGALVLDPAEKIVQRSVLSPLPQVLTDTEIEAVLLAADRYRRRPKPDARPYTLLALLLATGIKKSECLGIHLNHIELDAPDGPYLFVRYASPTNRYKERKLSLPEDWVPAYQEYLSQYNPTDRLFPWSPRRLEYLLEDIGRDAGLEKHLSFDMCRWTSALQDYLNNVEPEKIRQKMGVSKIQWREISMKLRQLASEQ
ncbi:MAG: site-specific integrase [Anaerolineales bacterium]|nr:site-specific integrase [Anaerolineales bacterium]MCX7609603.1 site-specific integrase [Anaerolineales bacterium]MDW8226259.1 site-specific integrase [Anaerolineales bacterium]